jgi:hypothetical protein
MKNKTKINQTSAAHSPKIFKRKEKGVKILD